MGIIYTTNKDTNKWILVSTIDEKMTEKIAEKLAKLTQGGFGKINKNLYQGGGKEKVQEKDFWFVLRETLETLTPS